MYILRVTNEYISNIIKSLTINEKTLSVLNNIIIRFDHKYINFIYLLFTVYLKTYVRITDDNCHLSFQQRKEILNNFSENIPNVKYEQIFIADKFDILFGSSATQYLDSSKLKSYFYEDIYNRIENITGVEVATEFMEDIFDSIEIIISSIEAYIVRIVNNNETEDSSSCVYLYLDLIDNSLVIVMY